MKTEYTPTNGTEFDTFIQKVKPDYVIYDSFIMVPLLPLYVTMLMLLINPHVWYHTGRTGKFVFKGVFCSFIYSLFLCVALSVWLEGSSIGS